MPQYPYNQPLGLAYKYIGTQTTTVVKASAGYLDRLVFWSGTSGAVITLYDNASAASGTIIAQITLAAGITVPAPAEICNILFLNGLTISTATQNAAFTVVYK